MRYSPENDLPSNERGELSILIFSALATLDSIIMANAGRVMCLEYFLHIVKLKDFMLVYWVGEFFLSPVRHIHEVAVEQRRQFAQYSIFHNLQI